MRIALGKRVALGTWVARIGVAAGITRAARIPGLTRIVRATWIAGVTAGLGPRSVPRHRITSLRCDRSNALLMMS